MNEPTYKVGDEVAFRNRCQPGMLPFRIGKVDSNMFNTLYQLEFTQGWWSEGCFMPFEEWKRK